jgi:CHRD domain-containing protein
MQHNKTLSLVIITGALLTLLIAATTVSSSAYAQNKFRAKLDGNNEVPPVDSAAEGVATFKLKDDAIKSKINITGINDVSGAQIFMGKIGQNGDPIVDLLKTGEKTNEAGGVSIKGNFTASDLEGSLNGKDLSALQSAMAGNQTFVNIMTSEHPDGEITGHIYSKGSTTGAEDNTANSDDSEGVSEEGAGESGDGNAEGNED